MQVFKIIGQGSGPTSQKGRIGLAETFERSNKARIPVRKSPDCKALIQKGAAEPY